MISCFFIYLYMKRDLNKILDRLDEHEKIQSEFISLLNEYLDEKGTDHPDDCDAITHIYCEDGYIYIQFEYDGCYEIPFKWIKDSEEYWKSEKSRLKEYWKTHYTSEIEKLNSRLETYKEKLRKIDVQ